MFSAIENSSTSPRRWRSSGMWPRPASKCSLDADARDVLSVDDDRAAVDAPQPGRSRRSARSGRCRRSPRCRRSRPRAPRTRRRAPSRSRGRRRPGGPRRSSSGSAGLAAVLSTRSRTSRPTISRARLASVAPSAGRVSTSLPRRSTVMRSAISSTSFSLWLMKMIDLPCAVRPRTISNSSRASCGVSTAVGSSRTRMSALRYSAFRISTRCCWPTVMSSMRARRVDREPEALRQLARPAARPRRRSSSTPACVGSDGEHDVLGDRHHRDEHEVLVHHPDAARRSPRAASRAARACP